MVGDWAGSWPIDSDFQRLRQSEIQHFDHAVGADFDVGGLQIAMNDPALVRGLERVGNLPRDGQGFVQCDAASRDAIGQRRPFDEFEHERFDLGAIFEAVNRRDVRMVQRGEHVRFALEAGERDRHRARRGRAGL